MKLKKGFVLRNVADQIVVLPSGDELNLNVFITLNETGKFLWEILEKGADESSLVEALLSEYEVDEITATACVREFVNKLVNNDFLEL